MIRPISRRKPGRPYCEAFPSIDVHAVVRAWSEERRILQWQDEDGLIVGHIVGSKLAEDHYRFHSRFLGTRNVESGTALVEVAIQRRTAGKYWSKPVFLCPGCARDVTRIYYVRKRWRCKTCHDLLSIVQRLDPVNKALYRRELYGPALQVGITSATERAKTERKRIKYGNAIRLLADETRDTLPAHLQHRSIGRWLAPGEVLKVKVERDEVGYGWTRRMRGQLPGLYTAAPDLPEPAGQAQEAIGRSRVAKRVPRPCASPAQAPERPLARQSESPVDTGGQLAPGAKPAFPIDLDLGLLEPFEMIWPEGF